MLPKSGEISNLQRSSIQLNLSVTGHFSWIIYRYCFEISPLLKTMRFITSTSLSTNTTGRNDGFG